MEAHTDCLFAPLCLFLQGVSGICNELRYVVFSPVGQATGRRVAMHFFDHILHLDMAFHLERKTGALSRVMERGKRSVTMIFRAVGELLIRLLFLSTISVPAVCARCVRDNGEGQAQGHHKFSGLVSCYRQTTSLFQYLILILALSSIPFYVLSSSNCLFCVKIVLTNGKGQARLLHDLSRLSTASFRMFCSVGQLVTSVCRVCALSQVSVRG